jgi:hypothetical protein
MRYATMLYKAPGLEPIHGYFLATTIVDADEEGAVEAALAEGWFLTTPEAVEAYEAEKAAAAPIAPSVGTDAASPATAVWGGVSAPAAQ